MALLFDKAVRSVVEVVAGKLHISVKEIVSGIGTSHPRSGDTVSSAEASHATAHAAAHHSAASHHSTHHSAGKVVESSVIGVVRIQDDAYLAVLLEVSDDSCALVTPPLIRKLMVIIIVALVRCIMTASGHHITEPAVHHALVDRKVDDGLLITVVNAGKSCLFRLSLNYLHLLHDLCRKVLCSELRVVEEEGLAVDRDLGDGLAVSSDGTVRVHLHARKLLEEVLKHVIVRCLE